MQYTKIQDMKFEIPTVGPFEVESEHRIVAAAGVSREFALLGDDDSGKTRIDLTGSYESHPGDPDRNDRGVVNLNLSRQIFGGIALALGASYATDPELKADSDKDFSANFGVSYKFTGLGGAL